MTKARDLANASTALSAVSATELAFVDGVTSAIQTQLDAKTAKSTLTTTGDIYYASAANTPARLGIGTTDQVLKVTAGVPAWATPAASASGLTLITAQAIGSGVSSVTVTNAFSTTYDSYKVILIGSVSSTASGNALNVTLGTTTTGYYYAGCFTSYNSTVSGLGAANTSGWIVGALENPDSSLEMEIYQPFQSKTTYFSANNTFPAGRAGRVDGSQYSNTSFTDLKVTPQGGTLTGGTLYVYGYAK
jgi:hypothetical protein